MHLAFIAIFFWVVDMSYGAHERAKIVAHCDANRWQGKECDEYARLDPGARSEEPRRFRIIRAFDYEDAKAGR